MGNSLRDRHRWLSGVVGSVVVAATVAGCETADRPSPMASPSSVTTSTAAPPQPWTLADLTYHPCSVLGPDDIARFVLEPEAKASTPPKQLPRCTWSSIQTGASGSFTIGFAPHNADLTDLGQRKVHQPLERTITVAGRRAVLDPTIRPDGRNGSCALHVSVPSGGSFYLGIAAPGIATGVDWDVCAKTIDVATTIAGRLR
ncbi:DUF3558 domain-containing protein [Nocardia barduliensis]|uniref:DUF3558 domain-containing protein n=1 Tax=Nocardia barduliensis TaxID=2736643 RepID=UPI0015734B9E|nr:DUF3558 domain-containing protein [Nocardia barduliensis]